jgi:hypothetical protein
MQDIRHRYCHYDEQEERHTKRYRPMPFGRHRFAKPKLVAKKSIASSPRFCDLRVALYSKANDAQRQGKPLSAGSSDLFFVEDRLYISETDREP